jgi:hypothetical protein
LGVEDRIGEEAIMNRDEMQSFIRVGPNWVSLEAYKSRKAEKFTEAVKAAAFLAIASLAAFLMLWGTP